MLSPPCTVLCLSFPMAQLAGGSHEGGMASAWTLLQLVSLTPVAILGHLRLWGHSRVVLKVAAPKSFQGHWGAAMYSDTCPTYHHGPAPPRCGSSCLERPPKSGGAVAGGPQDSQAQPWVPPSFRPPWHSSRCPPGTLGCISRCPPSTPRQSSGCSQDTPAGPCVLLGTVPKSPPGP